MENLPAAKRVPRVSAEELWSFCLEGRLAGTPGNVRAGEFLKRALEGLGFAAFEESPPTFSSKPLFLSLLLGALFSLATVIISRTPRMFFSVFFAYVVPVGVFFFRLRRVGQVGAPAAIYGVRKPSPPSAASQDAHPTVILCAHYDSASSPLGLSGSPLRVMLILTLLFAGVTGLARLTLPGLGLAVFIVLFWVLLSMRNDSPGADDNASGVFAVIECLLHLSNIEGVNLVPVFFNYEEIGLVGSMVWVHRALSQQRPGFLGFKLDPKRTFIINFDCVGRGRHLYVSGSRRLRERLLRTSWARAFAARRGWLYPSDHLAFRPRWNAVSLYRADRFWLWDLGWVHSRLDRPEQVRLDYLAEVAALVEEFVRDLASSASNELKSPQGHEPGLFSPGAEARPSPKGGSS